VKLAILGGTFNPPHIGHLFLAEEVYRALALDRVIFVPAHLPAHKEVAGRVPAADRLAMCRAAVQGCEYFGVDDCEVRRGGVSYMVDTVRDDLCSGFPGWKNARLLAETAAILLIHRLQREPVRFSFPHEYFDNRIMELSSSEIRERVRAGRPVRFLVPDGVYAYIEANRLYRD
jgi:nicotinate-nucleotide adenylyltransferase